MSHWLVVYDANKRFAHRYANRRVVSATSNDSARLETQRIEGDSWALTFSEVREARPAEVEWQQKVDLWLTCCKTGKAGRWIGL